MVGVKKNLYYLLDIVVLYSVLTQLSNQKERRKEAKMKFVVGLFVCFVIAVVNANPQAGEIFMLCIDFQQIFSICVKSLWIKPCKIFNCNLWA